MRNKLFTLMMLFLSTSFLFGQGQTDAPIYQNYEIPMCHEADDGTLTSYTVFQTIRLGDDEPCVVKTFDADGTEFTVPTGGKVTEGYCQTPNPTPDCEMKTYCDDGTIFFRIAQIVKTQTPTGYTTTVTMIDVTETGAIYTASGNEVIGECNVCIEGEAIVTPSNTTTTGTIAAGEVSVTVVNCGCANGTITVGGSTVPLYVGQTFEYDAYKNPLTNEWELSPEIIYDATGTEYCIETTAN